VGGGGGGGGGMSMLIDLGQNVFIYLLNFANIKRAHKHDNTV
jgi:hypothetical protein